MPVMEDFGVHVSIHLQSLQSLRGGVPEGLPAQMAEIAPVLKTFDTRVAEIAKDEKLSAIGKNDQLKSAVESAAADIEKWRSAKTTGIDAQMAGRRSALVAEADNAVPTPTDLQVANMIQRLAGFDPMEVSVLYSDATPAEQRVIETAVEAIGRQPVKRGDQLVWESSLPPERMVAMKETRLARVNPGGVAELNDLQRLRNTYDALAGSAKGLLQEVTSGGS